jgi:hypothetical protein
MPRHPPYALNNLTPQTIKDARIHYTILKHQPDTPPLENTYHPAVTHQVAVCPRTEPDLVIQKQQRVLPQDPTVCRARSLLMLFLAK